MNSKILKEREFGKAYYAIMAQIRDAIYDHFEKEPNGDWSNGVIADLERYKPADVRELLIAGSDESGQDWVDVWDWFNEHYQVYTTFRKDKSKNKDKAIRWEWNDDLEMNSLVIVDDITKEVLLTLNSTLDFNVAPIPGDVALLDFDESDIDTIIDYLRQFEIYESRKDVKRGSRKFNESRKDVKRNTPRRINENASSVWRMLDRMKVDQKLNFGSEIMFIAIDPNPRVPYIMFFTDIDDVANELEEVSAGEYAEDIEALGLYETTWVCEALWMRVAK